MPFFFTNFVVQQPVEITNTLSRCLPSGFGRETLMNLKIDVFTLVNVKKSKIDQINSKDMKGRTRTATLTFSALILTQLTDQNFDQNK